MMMMTLSIKMVRLHNYNDDDGDSPLRGGGQPREHWDGSKVEVEQPPEVIMIMKRMTTTTI